jgi:phosphate transport system substrate-binding protein
MDACKQADVAYVEIPIAFDAITIAVNPRNTWAKDITMAELKKVWELNATGKNTSWQQVRRYWVDHPIHLYGSDQNSGTFDYFTEVTNGRNSEIRADYRANAQTNDTVKAIIRDPDELGFFGFGYYQANASQLKPLAIDGGRGAVLSSKETVQAAEYLPFSRPVFVYVNARAAQDKPEVKAFVEFCLKNAERLVNKSGYV